ncbi:MAG: metal ABC transporter ATP-binding protein [Candidatus Peribacteraceae bacterium]|nr:metal ABC transporter ATP-binding protein [Candidatus Peribacteraceae bacterium]
MPVSPAAIQAEHLAFGFKGTDDVLSDVSFSVPVGAYAGLIGPNGGGKTTLIKVILGQLQPSAGTVTVFGLTPRHAAQHRLIGYVQQRAMGQEVLLPLTVRELITNGALLPGLSLFSNEKRKRAQVDRALEELSITDLEGRLLSSLSGGQRQRAFIARALVSKPRLLILDEPTTGIDPRSRDEFHELLTTIHRSGVSLLYVSHDTDVIANHATRLLCLNRTLVADCAPEDLSSEEAVRKIYGQTVGHIHHRHHRHHHHGG